jgi:cytochrome c oxidase assembly protein subunit 15
VWLFYWLVDEPRVSHYRLAAHLSIAFIIIAYISWIILDIKTSSIRCYSEWRRIAIAIAILVGIQIIYGAFTAGTHAGIGYNTFPKMHDQWIADSVFSMSPLWLNLFESHATIQFMHRLLGSLLLLGALFFWLIGRGRQTPRQRKWSFILLITVLLQYALGVYTLVKVVPIAAASIHQMFACAVLLAVTALIHSYSRGENPVSHSK